MRLLCCDGVETLRIGHKRTEAGCSGNFKSCIDASMFFFFVVLKKFGGFGHMMKVHKQISAFSHSKERFFARTKKLDMELE